jgi:hypothetical protein
MDAHELQTVLAFLEQHFPSAAAVVLRELDEHEGEGTRDEDAGEVEPAPGIGKRPSGDEGGEEKSESPSKLDDGVSRCVGGPSGDLELTLPSLAVCMPPQDS